jgi:hypothetical protein
MSRIVRVVAISCAAWLPLTVPASMEISIVGGLTREAIVRPGDTLEGKILVGNTTTKEKHVKAYQTDYLCYADGRNSYGEPGSCSRSNAAWITVTPEQFTIPPEGSGTLYYTIRVPNSDELVGTYWSMLMIEPLIDDTPEVIAGDDDEPRVAIRTVMRYGIQMVTHIGSTGEQSVKFGDKQLVASDARRLLKVDVESTGERSLTPLLWAELYDADGVSIGRFEGQRMRIFPMCSVRYNIDLSGVPVGTYNALIVADNGDDSVFGTQAKLQIQ